MKINNLKFLVCALFALGDPAQAAAQNLCTEGGMELVYIRRYVEDGDVKWVHRMRFGEVERFEDGGMEVNYTSQLFKASGRAITKEPIKAVAEIDSEGNVAIDLSLTMVSVMRGFLGNGVTIGAEGGKAFLPAELRVGDVLPDASTTIKALGMKMRITVTEREVIGEEYLETPAGAFHCMVISEHKVEKGMGRNRITTAHTWYAKGIGMVRHDTYDKKGVLETSEVLTQKNRIFEP